MTKIFRGYITYIPKYCPCYGVVNEYTEINKFCNISNNTVNRIIYQLSIKASKKSKY